MNAAPALSPRQMRAIAALLVSDTQAEAATRARVPERTLRSWMDVPAFTAELARQRDRLLSVATLRLARAADRAVAALDAIAGDRAAPPGARVAAARAILDATIPLTEFSSMSDRVAALERAWDASRAPSFAGGPS